MSTVIESLSGYLCFVIDSPMNAFVASFVGRHAEKIDVIYALDPDRKDVDEYLALLDLLLSELPVNSRAVIEFDSARFWGGEKNAIVAEVHKKLAPLVRGHAEDVIYFGNCLTNPVALALKRYGPVNHLYHAPGDFVSMLFPTGNPWKAKAKTALKRLMGRELYMIEPSDLPIFTLLNFGDQPNFLHLDYRNFESSPVRSGLSKMIQAMDASETNIMLLLAGDEPEPGDKNSSNIEKYLQPHLSAVDSVLTDNSAARTTLWIKEHKSYLPLTDQERRGLAGAFSDIGCQVRFVADYLPIEFRSLPGECILRYCPFNYIVAEPSAFLFNVAGTEVTAVAAISAFAPLRDLDQQGRNAEFSAINARLLNPIRIT